MSQDLLRDPRRLARRRRPTRSRRPTASWPGSCTPTSTPTRRRQERFKEVTARLRGALRPREAPDVRPRRRPASAAPASAVPAPARASRSPTSWTRSSAAGRRRRGGSGRGPRPRVRRGQDALIRLDVELAEAAFGTTHELKVDTAVLCTRLQRRRARPRARTRSPARPAAAAARPCTCSARSSARSARMRPCAACRGFGTIIPEPCRECSGDGRVRSRRTLTVKIPAGVDTGTRVQLSGQGEVGPGGGPAGDLYVEMHVSAAPGLHPARRRPALPRDGPDDGRRARHDDRAAHARGGRRRRRTPTSRRPCRSTIRPGTQSGTETVLGGRGVPSLRGTGRGDLVVTDRRGDPDAARRPAGGAAPRAGRAARRGVAGRSASTRRTSRCSTGCATRSARDEPAGLRAPRAWPVPRVGDAVELAGDEARHAVVVKRIRVGEQVTLTDGAGTSATCTVTATSRVVAVRDGATRSPPPSPRCRGWSWSRRSRRATAASSPSRCSPRSAST